MKKYSKKWWKEWFKKSTVRALWTFGQVLLAQVSVEGVALLNVDWKSVLLVSLISGIISYIKSFVVGLPELEENNE